jgi:hypothetical protein
MERRNILHSSSRLYFADEFYLNISTFKGPAAGVVTVCCVLCERNVWLRQQAEPRVEILHIFPL